MKQETFARRLSEALECRQLKAADLSRLTGVSEGTISCYINGKYEAKQTRVRVFAKALDVDPVWLMGYDVPMKATDDASSVPIPPGFEPLPQMTQVPLVGRIACGQPITAEQNIESVIGVPSAWHADFALTCRGDSMQPRYLDGDIVCIHRQPEVENGQIAAVRIGEEATLKRFYRQGDTVTLQAENPAYPPLVYQKEELNSIAIEGRVVGICRGEK